MTNNTGEVGGIGEMGVGSKMGPLCKDGEEMAQRDRKMKVSRAYRKKGAEERLAELGVSEGVKARMGLSLAERRFMSKKMKGGTVRECMEAAGWVRKMGGWQGKKWGECMNERMVAYEAEVMEKAMEGDIMSARERREFLAKLVRDGRDGKGMSTTTRYVDEDGREKKVVAAPDFKDQLRAVELDAKLSGDLVAEKVPYEALNVTAILAGLSGTAGKLPMQLMKESDPLALPEKGIKVVVGEEGEVGV